MTEVFRTVYSTGGRRVKDSTQRLFTNAYAEQEPDVVRRALAHARHAWKYAKSWRARDTWRYHIANLEEILKEIDSFRATV